MCKTEEELRKLPEDSQDIFKRNMLDRYIDRANKTFLQGKFAVIDDLCYAEFCSNYRLDAKVNYDDLANDNQPNILTDLIVEENHRTPILPNTVPVMSNKEVLKCRKTRKVLRYYTPNKHRYPERYAHHLLMLFYPFRDEENDLKAEGLYMTKLNQPEVLEVVNRNRRVFEPNAELIDLALRNVHEDLRHNQDLYAQQENDEVQELISHQVEQSEDENEHQIDSNDTDTINDCLLQTSK